MKKGFTLMEILAVLLVIAVVASFAVPMVRSVMVEVRYQRAKAAGRKMVEAIRTLYTDSKGYRVDGDMTGAQIATLVTDEDSCHNPAITGVPPYNSSSAGTIEMAQLFHCNYLSTKDFAGLNYEFKASVCQGTATCLLEVCDKSPSNNKKCFRIARDTSLLGEGIDPS